MVITFDFHAGKRGLSLLDIWNDIIMLMGIAIILFLFILFLDMQCVHTHVKNMFIIILLSESCI